MKKLFTLLLLASSIFFVAQASDYYWVGDGGNWSDLSHWASSSGGSGSAYGVAPTSADNVYFDANSFSTTGQTVVLDVNAVCLDMDWTGVTNSPYFDMLTYGYYLELYGSLTLDPGMTTDFYDVYFYGVDPTHKLTTNDVALGNYSNFYFYGSGTYTVEGELYANSFYLFSGTLVFSSNYAEIDNFYIYSGGTKSLVLNDCEFLVFDWFNGDDANSTLNAGTSVIRILDNFQGNFGTSTLTYNIVKFEGSSGYSDITGPNTIDSLIIANSVDEFAFDISYTQTINYLFTESDKYHLLNIHSSSTSTQAYVNAANNVSLDWVQLQDIYMSGGATYEASNSVDLGNNSNWDFLSGPTGEDYYWIGGTGTLKDLGHWASTSGGPADMTTLPSQFDNLIFDDNSFSADGQVVTIDTSITCRDFDMSGLTMYVPSLLMDHSNGQLHLFGSFLLAADVNLDLDELYFDSDSSGNLITTNGNYLGSQSYLEFDGSGTWMLTDSISLNEMSFYNGHLVLNGQSVQTIAFDAYGSSGDTLDISNSKIYVRYYNSGSGGVFLTDLSTLYFTDPGSNYFNGAGRIYYDFVIDGPFTFEYNDNTFHRIEIRPGSDVAFPPGYTQITDDFTANGTKLEPITLRSNSQGSQAYIQNYSSAVTTQYLNIRDISADGDIFGDFVAYNSIDNGNNTGWTINAPTPLAYYWIGDGGNWSDLSHWSEISGGSATMTDPPGVLDDVYFDENSFSASGQEVVLDFQNLYIHTLDMGALDESVKLKTGVSNQTLHVNGSFYLTDLVDLRLNNLYFESAGSGNEIDYSGATVTSYPNLYFYGSGDYTLLDSLTCSGLYFYSGSLDLNDQPIFCGSDFQIGNNDNPRSVSLTSSDIYLGYSWNLYSRNLTFDPGTSTIIFNQYWNYFYGDNYNDTITYNDVIFQGTNAYINDNSVFNNMAFYNGVNAYFENGKTTWVNQLEGSGSASNTIQLYANSGTFNLVDASGSDTVSYAVIQGSQASGGATFIAVESTDNGSNTGWSFVADTDPPVFIAGYPSLDIHENYLRMRTRTDEASDVFYVVLPDTSAAPGRSEVMAGTGSGGESPTTYGSFTIDNTQQDYIQDIYNLNDTTAYNIYLLARDGASTPNLQDTTTVIPFVTQDPTPPVFQSGYPVINDIGEDYVSVIVQLDENCRVYWVVVPGGSPAPTPAQVRNGQASDGGSPVSYNNNYINQQQVIQISMYGLQGDTDYDIYLVAQDQANNPNLQASVVMLQAHTDVFAAPVYDPGYPYIQNSYNFGFDIRFDMDEQCNVYYVAMAQGSSTPTPAEVKAGKGAGGVDPLAKGSMNVYSDQALTRTLSGLEETTSYDIFLVAEDYVTPPNIQDTVVKLTGTTTIDGDPPYYYNNPYLDYIDYEKAVIKFQLNEKGTLYYVVINDTTVQPTASEVRAGTGPGGSAIQASGTVDQTVLNQLTSLTIHGLSPEQDYDIAFTADDDSPVPNQMTSSYKIDVTTTRGPLNYYWVGDGGSWSDLSHWVDASGGTNTRTELPTSVDSVFFDANSFTMPDQEVVINQDISSAYFDMSTVTNDPQLTLNYNLYAYGDINIPEPVDYYLYNVYLKGDTSTVSISTSDDGSDYLQYIRADGPGYYNIPGPDSLYLSGFYFYEGHVVIDRPVYFGWLNIQDNDRQKQLDINADRLYLNEIDYYEQPDAFTFNAPGTDLRIRSSMYGTGSYPHVTITDNASIYGTNSFDTLVVEPGVQVRLESNKTQTVDQLVVNGNKTENIRFYASTAGQQATLSKVSGTVDGNYLVLQDNNATGGAVFNATNSIDDGNNTGWNISAIIPLDYYWIGGSGNWSDVSHWSTTSGGSPDHTEIPGRFEDAVFDANSFADGGTIVIDIDAQVADLDFSGANGLIEVDNPDNHQLGVYGSLMLADDMNFYTDVYLYSDSAGNVISNGHNMFNYGLYFYGDGEYTLTDSLAVWQLTLYNGTLDLNDQPVWAYYFNIQNSDPKTLNLTSSDIYLGYRWYMNSANVNFDAGTSTFHHNGAWFYADEQDNGTYQYNNIIIDAYVRLIDPAAFNVVTITSGNTLRPEGGSTYTVNELFATGTKTNPVSLLSYNSGNQFTIVKTSGEVNVSNVILQDAAATGGATFNVFEGTDNGNNSGWNFLSDTTAPQFNPGYPHMADTTETSLTLVVSMNEGGTVYYVMMPDGSTMPTVQEVMNGTGSGGTSALSSGSIAITNSNTEFDEVFSGLTLNTEYDLFMVARDDADSLNVQDTVTLFNAHTTGNVPPFFRAGYPAFTKIYESRVDFDIRVSEASDVYYAVEEAGMPVPTPSELVAGGLANFVSSGNYNHNNASSTYNRSLQGMTAATDYVLYLTARDKAASPNLMDSVAKLPFTTAELAPPVFGVGYPYLTNVQDRRFGIYFNVDEPSTIFYIVVPNGAAAPSVDQVMYGQDASDSDAMISGTYNANSYNFYGWTQYIYGVEPLTDYDVYVVAQDKQVPPNIQASVVKLDLTTTSDTYAPNFESGPDLAYEGEDYFDVVFKLDESGTVYYVVDTTGSSQPTATQVFAGTNSADGPAIVSGTIPVALGFDAVYESISGLMSLGMYKAYFAIEDSAPVPNQNGSVWSLDVETTRAAMDYYWVGDGGNWSDTSHWATTSGGTTHHAEPPTKVDDVYFDQNSFTTTGQQVNVDMDAYFHDMTWENIGLQPDFYATYSYPLHTTGSLFVPDSIRFRVRYLYLQSADIDTLSLDFSQGNDYLSYVYMQSFGEYTMTDSIYISSFYHYYGDMILNAPVYFNYYVAYGGYYYKSLTVNDVDFNVYQWNKDNNSEFDLVLNNSVMKVGYSMSDNSDYREYNHVQFINDVNLSTSLTIDTLVINPGTTVTLQAGETLTVDSLTAIGTKPQLIEITSTDPGQQAFIEKYGGTVNAEYLKISDNAATGGAVFNAFNSVDLGNNSGWNFTAPTYSDYYWIGGTGDWSDLSHWSTTSGGTADHTELPGEYENVYFDGNSFDAGGESVNLDLPEISVKTIDMSQAGHFPLMWGSGATLYVYGSFLLSDSIDWNVRYVHFQSDSAGNTINEAGAGQQYPYFYFEGNGEWTLTDSISVYRIYHNYGTLNLNDQPVNVNYFYSTSGQTRTLNMGSSIVNVLNFWYISSSNITLDAGSSTIQMLNGGTFRANNSNISGIGYNNLVVDNYLYLYDSTSFNQLVLNPGTQLYLEQNNNFHVNNLYATGEENNRITIASQSTGTQAGLMQASGTVTGYYLDIYDNVASGGATFQAYYTDTTNSVGWELLKAAQTVSFDTVTYLDFDPTGLKLTASATSDDTITYELLSGDGTVSNDTLYPNAAGSFEVRAYQEGNAYYMPSDTAEHTYIVQKLDQTISFDSLPNMDVSDGSFVLTATASSGLTVAYSVSGVASVSGSTVTLSGETGVVTVTAIQAGNEQYNPAQRTRSFTVTDASKTDQTITFDAISDQTYSDVYVVLSASASSDLDVTFSIESGPATVSQDTLYISGAGEITVSALQAGDATFNPAPAVSQTFTVNKASQTISFTDIGEVNFGDDPHTLSASATSGLPVTFLVNDGPGYVTGANGDQLVISGAGTLTVSAYQNGSANYLKADSVKQEIEVGKASQEIVFQNFPDVNVDDGPITLTCTATSGLPVSYSVSGPVTLGSGVLNLTGDAGTVIVTVTQAGNSNYKPVSESKSFAVTDPNKTDQTITFTDLPDEVEIGDATVSLTASASSGLTVSFIVNGPGALSGTTITLTGYGTITVTAIQDGNATYNPAPPVEQSFDVIPNVYCPDPVDWADTAICAGLSLDLSITSETGHSYTWVLTGTTDTITSNSASLTEAGTYLYREVLDSSGCVVTDFFDLTLNDLPDFNYTLGSNEIDPGNTAAFTMSTGSYDYGFSPADDVEMLSSTVYNVSPSENTTYTVTGTNPSTGCSSDLTADIFVRCSACGDETMTDESGLFNHGCFNRNYRNNANCTWTIIPSGMVPGILIEFAADSFDIKSGDMIMVYAGTDANGDLVGTYDNDNPPPARINISGGAAFIHFTSDATGTGQGFQAHYSLATGVEGALDRFISVYPNPSTGRFMLEIDPARFDKAEAEVYSTLGEKLWNRQLEPANGSVRESIELDDFAKGLYYLRIVTEDGTYFKTIVIE